MSDDRPPLPPAWGAPAGTPLPPPPPPASAPPRRGRGRTAVVLAVAVVVVAGLAVGALLWWRDGDGNDAAAEFGLLYQAGRGRTTFVLADPDDAGEVATFTVPLGADAAATIFPAGRGRALIASDEATVLVPLDGGEPTEVAPERLLPAGPWAAGAPERLEGLLLSGGAPDAHLALDFATGDTRPLDTLVDADGPYIVTGYSGDGRHASVLAGQELWLVPLTEDGEARSFGEARGALAPGGDQLVVVRGRRDGPYTVGVAPTDGGDEEEVWAGPGPVTATWVGDDLAVIGLEDAVLVDPDGGEPTELISGTELDVASPFRAGGALVASADDDLRWYRLDTGDQVGALRGLDVPVGTLPGAWALFAEEGSDPRVAAWDPAGATVVALEGTAAQRERLARGSQNGVVASPDGRFVVTGFALGPDEPVVLGDLAGGQAVDVDGVDVAGQFSPDSRLLLVRRTATSGGPGPVAIVDAAEPNAEGVELPRDVGAAGWVYR